MYRLFYDDLTGQYFIANQVVVETNLKMLRKKVMKTFQFTLNEYCRALTIPEEDPFDSYVISACSFDIPFLFRLDLSMEGGTPIPVMRVEIAG